MWTVPIRSYKTYLSLLLVVSESFASLLNTDWIVRVPRSDLSVLFFMVGRTLPVLIDFRLTGLRLVAGPLIQVLFIDLLVSIIAFGLIFIFLKGIAHTNLHRFSAPTVFSIYFWLSIQLSKCVSRLFHTSEKPYSTGSTNLG